MDGRIGGNIVCICCASLNGALEYHHDAKHSTFHATAVRISSQLLRNEERRRLLKLIQNTCRERSHHVLAIGQVPAAGRQRYRLRSAGPHGGFTADSREFSHVVNRRTNCKAWGEPRIDPFLRTACPMRILAMRTSRVNPATLQSRVDSGTPLIQHTHNKPSTWQRRGLFSCTRETDDRRRLVKDERPGGIPVVSIPGKRIPSCRGTAMAPLNRLAIDRTEIEAVCNRMLPTTCANGINRPLDVGRDRCCGKLHWCSNQDCS